MCIQLTIFNSVFMVPMQWENIVKLFNCTIFHKNNTRKKYLWIKRDILIVSLHLHFALAKQFLYHWNTQGTIIYSWNMLLTLFIHNQHHGILAKIERTANTEWQCSFICIHIYTYICICVYIHVNFLVICDVLYESLGTRPRNSDYCANVSQQREPILTRARININR